MSLTLAERSRAELARAVRSRVAGPEFETAAKRLWETPGPRWFGESDAIWRVHNDASMFVGGIRALLLQSLHPVAMAAVNDHSDFREDPWGRLQRTSHFLSATTYGTIPDAERSIEIVRAVHDRVSGTTPEGIAYRADDPDLLAWVHIAEIDSFLNAHQVFGEQPLSADGADEYVRQSALVASRLGVEGPPLGTAQLAERLAAYRPLLRSTPPAREAAELLLRHPPLSGLGRGGYAALAAGAISLLPPWARAELGLPTLPLSDRAVARPLTRTALRVLRWALAPDSADHRELSESQRAIAS
jgi:uncharacterized protein (DUF2236 family)